MLDGDALRIGGLAHVQQLGDFTVGAAAVAGDRVLDDLAVATAEQFGSAPMLVRSNPGFKTATLSAAGMCRPSDRFLLATDAVAARLFKNLAIGTAPDWLAFETIDADAWQQDLDNLRKTNEMVNDDCTLVVLRIMGSEAEKPADDESEPGYAPD